MHRSECYDRLQQVGESYQSARQTVQALTRIAGEHPNYLNDYDLSIQILRTLEAELHDIYFVRVFASFESSLRHYWRTSVRDSSPPTAQLLESIAARRGIPQNTLDSVHEVRRFRNHLIHEEHEHAQPVTLDDARRHLNTYLARLPLEW